MKNSTKTINSSAKTKTSLKSLLFLAKYGKKYLVPFIIAIVLAILGVVCTLIGPNKLGDLANTISAGINGTMDTDKVFYIGIFLVVIYGLSAIFNYIQGYIMAVVTQKITKNLRADVSKKTNKLPQGYIDKTGTGEITSRITNDIDLIAQALNNSFSTIVNAITLILGCVVMMLVTNWILALGAMVASILGMGLVGLIVSKSQKHFIAQQQQLGKINARIEEDYNAHILVSTNNGFNNSSAAFDKENSKLYASAWKSQFLSGLMQPLMAFAGNLGFVVVCVLGAVLCTNNIIDIGVIVSFMVYVRLFSQPLGQFAQGLSSMQSASAATQRVFEVLNAPEMEDESKKTATLNAQEVRGNVEFVNVNFGYEPQKPIIKDFNLSVKAGQKVAIVGPTGAGKTTLVNLLMRFYELDSGQIKIDGVPTSSLTREQVHSLFGMVLQDTWLFEGTIKENLIYNKDNVTDEQIIKSCQLANIDHFIRTLPQGYNTLITDSVSISAGQKQLLTIARAMIQNSPMLILDEATSSVDTRTETQIQQAMDNLTKGRTSFIIAHRLSTIKNADVILVMQNGSIVEQGNHKTLMQQNGVYAGLYNSQFTKAGSLIEEEIEEAN